MNKQFIVLNLFVALLLVGCVKKKEETSTTTQNQTSTVKPKQQRANTKRTGSFIEEMSSALNIPKGKATQINQLIKTYQRQGKNFKYFGWIKGQDKGRPFQKDLKKILTPIEIEQWKSIHAYWFDHRSGFPLDPYELMLSLDLSKDQFFKLVKLNSETIVKTRNLPKYSALIAKQKRQGLARIFTKEQMVAYRAVISNYMKQ